MDPGRQVALLRERPRRQYESLARADRRIHRRVDRPIAGTHHTVLVEWRPRHRAEHRSHRVRRRELRAQCAPNRDRPEDDESPGERCCRHQGLDAVRRPGHLTRRIERGHAKSVGSGRPLSREVRRQRSPEDHRRCSQGSRTAVVSRRKTDRVLLGSQRPVRDLDDRRRGNKPSAGDEDGRAQRLLSVLVARRRANHDRQPDEHADIQSHRRASRNRRRNTAVD